MVELIWQNGRQLASMQFMQMRFEFTYDVDGLRTSKTVSNVDLVHNYYYVGSRLEYETIGDSEDLWYYYDADENPFCIKIAPKPCTRSDSGLFGVLGMRNNLAVKVRYRLGSRNC